VNGGAGPPEARDPRFDPPLPAAPHAGPARWLALGLIVSLCALVFALPRALRLGPLVAENRMLTEAVRTELGERRALEVELDRWRSQLDSLGDLFEERCVDRGAQSIEQEVPEVGGSARTLLAEFDAVTARLVEARDANEELLRRLEAGLGNVRAAPGRLPLGTEVVTSGFGRRRDPFDGSAAHHGGVDMDGESGDPVFAVASGVVREAGWHEGYGWRVRIDHGYGMESVYAHLKVPPSVEVGAWVLESEEIGLVGSSGNSTGSHLHWEIWVNGRPRDPLSFLPRD
jgi:murein DD-endopeptidase MepM/ murein hydrolase activator NlpD